MKGFMPEQPATHVPVVVRRMLICHYPPVSGPGHGRPGAILAIVAALVALAVSLVAVAVVVIRRAPVPQAGLAEHAVAAPVLAKLGSQTVEEVQDQGSTIGMKVTDEALSASLELEPDDVITAIAGRPLKRRADVPEAMRALRLVKAETIDVDLVRDHRSIVVRWRVTGDRDPALPGGSADGAAAAAGSLGALSGSGGSVDDAVLASIVRHSELQYSMPRASLHQIIGDLPAYLFSGARVVQ
jgi:hypothetical protein